jgi:formylglycine-generating enzyme required for sulfatase activity
MTSINPVDGAVYSFIPAGEFEMGSDDVDSSGYPAHSVKLDAFWIGQTEVTNASYRLCVEAGHCGVPSNGNLYYVDAGGNHPVVVTWYDGQKFCEWVGGRLPTEAEWEKAARGGMELMLYPWGDAAPVCTDDSVESARYYQCGFGTVPVGSFSPNGYGLFDVAGNSWEWVGDWYNSDYYSNSPISNPQGPDLGEYRVVRGGSWDEDSVILQVARREWRDPYDIDNHGFRCVLSDTPVYYSITNPIDSAVYKYIPAGEFQMGSECCDETPVHGVTVDAFWLGQTEVTNRQFAEFLNAMDYKSRQEDGVFWVNERTEDFHIHQIREEWQVDDGYSDHPAVGVSWEGAQTYCEWAGGRLPTEAEWEKAARGGLEGGVYPWGDESPTCSLGAENGGQHDMCDGGTASVGSYSPNGYGLYDMAGNVLEWVGDWYDAQYYQYSVADNPTGPDSGYYRVLRGGSWDDSTDALRVAFRLNRRTIYTYADVGFRCVIELP